MPSSLENKQSTAFNLDALRNFTTSLTDVEHWFENNPKAILGNAQFPDDAHIKFTLNIDQSTLLRTLLQEGHAALSIKVEVSYLVQSPFTLETEFVNEDSEPVIYFNVETFTDVNMEEWPLVTAMAAEAYLFEGHMESSLMLYQNFGLDLDQNIQKHFQGWTLDRLVNLLKADLLPVDGEGLPEAGVICELLFKARTPAPQELRTCDLGFSL